MAGALVGWRAALAPTEANARVVLLIGAGVVVLLLVATLAAVPTLLPWPIGGLAAVYGAGMPVHVGSPSQATAYGIGMLLSAELAYGAFDEVTRVRGEPGTQRYRVVLLLTVVAATLAVDEVALGSAELSTGDEVLLVAATLSVVLLLAAVTVLVARRRPAPADGKASWADRTGRPG